MLVPEQAHAATGRLLSLLYTAGVETLFNVDTLRSATEPQAETTLDTALKQIAITRPTAVLQCLPRLFRSFIEVVKKHRGLLFCQGSSINQNQLSSSNMDQARSASMKNFAMHDTLANQVPANALTWQTKSELLVIVDEEDLHSPNDALSINALRACAEHVLAAMNKSFQGRQHTTTLPFVTNLPCSQ